MDNILRLWYNDIRIVISVPICIFGDLGGIKGT